MNPLAFAAQGVSDLVNNGVSLFNSWKDRESNERINRRTNATNEKIAEQNLSFQRENLEYQKALQQQVFDREDSAAQRSVRDLYAAGISPLAGFQPTSGAGEAIQTEPLHNDYQEQAHYVTESQFQPQFTSFLDAINGIQQYKSAEKENEYKDAVIDSQKLKNQFDASTLVSRVDNIFSDALIRRYQALDERSKAVYNAHYGITSNMSEKEKIAMVLATEAGLISPQGDGFDFRTKFEDLQSNFRDFVSYGSPQYVTNEKQRAVIRKQLDKIFGMANSVFDGASSSGSDNQFLDFFANRDDFSWLKSLFGGNK